MKVGSASFCDLMLCRDVLIHCVICACVATVLQRYHGTAALGSESFLVVVDAGESSQNGRQTVAAMLFGRYHPVQSLLEDVKW